MNLGGRSFILKFSFFSNLNFFTHTKIRLTKNLRQSYRLKPSVREGRHLLVDKIKNFKDVFIDRSIYNYT